MPGHKGSKRGASRKTLQAKEQRMGSGQIGLEVLGPLPYKDIRLYAAAKAVKGLQDGLLGLSGAVLKVSEVLAQVRMVRAELHGWISSYQKRERWPGEGFPLFREHWLVLRVWVPLQMRLCVEQILQDMGAPWNTLITGFRPISK